MFVRRVLWQLSVVLAAVGLLIGWEAWDAYEKERKAEEHLRMLQEHLRISEDMQKVFPQQHRDFNQFRE